MSSVSSSFSVLHSGIFLVILLCVGGCATKPVPTEQAAIVPDKRIHAKQLAIPNAEAGVVIVKRDSGFTGAACNSSIFVDGNLSAELAPGEKVAFYLSEGPHIISFQQNNPCGGAMAEIEAHVTKSRPLVFRIGTGSGWEYFISPTAF